MSAHLEELQTLEGHDDRVWHISWSPSGASFASCSGDKTVRIWSKDSIGHWSCSTLLDGAHSRTVRSCTWSPDGQYLATASFDRTIAIWELVSGTWEQAAVLEGHESEVKGVAWNPNGTLIATCGRDKTVWVWEAQPGHEYEVVDVKHGHSQDVKTVLWHPQGELLVSASYDDSVKLWKESDDEWICAQTLSGSDATGHTSTVWDVCFSPKGDYLASCSDDKTIKIWKLHGNNNNSSDVKCGMIASLSGFHSRTVFSVDWSADDYIASCGADNTIQIFKFSEQSDGGGGESCVLQSRKTQAHSLDVNCVRFNPKDPNVLVSAGDDGVIKVWQLILE